MCTVLLSLALGGCQLHLGKPIHNRIYYCCSVSCSIMMTNCWGLIVVSLSDLIGLKQLERMFQYGGGGAGKCTGIIMSTCPYREFEDRDIFLVDTCLWSFQYLDSGFSPRLYCSQSHIYNCIRTTLTFCRQIGVRIRTSPNT